MFAEGLCDRPAQAADNRMLLGRHYPARLACGFYHGLDVQRLDGREVHQMDTDALFGEYLGRDKCSRRLGAGPEYGDVFPFTDGDGLADFEPIGIVEQEG